MAGNDAIYGKKERRRLSLERTYTSDYINYRENFELKKIIENQSKDKIHFADNVTKYDRRSRRQRRILLVAKSVVFIVAIEKNKDKETRRQKPFIYLIKRSIPTSSITRITVSTHQDNFVNLSVSGEFDNLFECRRKTEFLSVSKKILNLSIDVSDSMNVILKGGKRRAIKFVTDAKAGEGKMKGTKVSVAPGISKDTRPNKPEPKQIETHTIMPVRNLAKKTPAPSAYEDAYASGGAPSPRGGYGGGGGRPAPSPRGGGYGGAPAPSPRGGGYGGGAPSPRAPSIARGSPFPGGRGSPPVPGGRGGFPIPGGPPPRGRGRGGY